MKNMLCACGVALVCLSASTVAARQISLEAAVNEIRGGDPLRGLATLNDALKQSAESPQVAMIHAYRALAFVRMDQPERARAAAVLALQANANLVIGLPDFTPDVVAMFDRVRRAPANPEDAATVAEAAGRFQDAFVSLVAAYRALPSPMPPNDDRRLRERIIITAQKLATPPAIPAQARDHANKAQSLLDADALLGKSAGTAAAQAAAAELRQAVRLAPWWGDAALRLATQLQKLQLVDEALLNLGMYKLADPDGYAATVARAAPTVATAPLAPAVPKPLGPATIYIYWPEQQRGGGRQKVLCNGQQVAELQNNRFVVLKAATGTHDLAFRDKHVTAVVENGGEYHYRASIEGQWRFAMGPDIRLTTAESAKDEMNKQGMAPNDARRTRSTECVAPRAPRR